jgi:ribosomal protein S11
MSINQSDNWIYGYKQWLTFSGGSAEVVYSGFNNTIVSLNSSRGAASVSDTSGNLLF